MLAPATQSVGQVASETGAFCAPLKQAILYYAHFKASIVKLGLRYLKISKRKGGELFSSIAINIWVLPHKGMFRQQMPLNKPVMEMPCITTEVYVPSLNISIEFRFVRKTRHLSS